MFASTTTKRERGEKLLGLWIGRCLQVAQSLAMV